MKKESESKPEPKNCGDGCVNCAHVPSKTCFSGDGVCRGGTTWMPRNCENCGRYYTGKCYLPGAVIQIQEIVKGCGDWQPKPAEPQGWEQRFDKEFPHCGGAFKTSLRAFIRAEIERVREEEKQAIVAFLRGHWLMTDGLAPMAGDIERNKHREGGK